MEGTYSNVSCVSILPRAEAGVLGLFVDYLKCVEVELRIVHVLYHPPEPNQPAVSQVVQGIRIQQGYLGKVKEGHFTFQS